MRQPFSSASTRANALWGKNGRGRVTGTVLASALLLLSAGTGSALAATKSKGAFVPSSLLRQAQQRPQQSFDVIVRGVPGEKSASIATYFTQGGAGKLKNEFYSVNGVAGTLTGADLIKLAANNHVFSITSDRSLGSTAYENQEVWRKTTGVLGLLGSLQHPAPAGPAIAVVDSGVDLDHPDLAGKLVPGATFTGCAESPNVAMAESRTAVAAAFAGNAALAVLKGIAAATTGSAAMLAETFHSVADTGNQALLFLGMRLARRPPDARHPFATFRMDEVDAQDFMAWETQGPILDRTHERLAVSDHGVVQYREMLKREIDKVKQGMEPMNVFRDPDHPIIDTMMDSSLEVGRAGSVRYHVPPAAAAKR